MSSQWTVIKARVPSIDRIVAPFEKEMEHYLDIAEKRFDKTIATWQHKPAFQKQISKKGSLGGLVQIEGVYYTEDSIYNYVSEGTRVRYATMTKGFQAKTKPGRQGSTTGHGGLAYVSRNKPRPGIQARKFDELIAKGTERNFYSAFDRAVDAAIRVLDKP